MMIKINDIKPIVKIPDLSIFLYYGAILIFIILLLIVIFYLYKYFKPKQKSKEDDYYQYLKNLDLNDIKNSAYAISKYGNILAKDERQIRLIEELDDSLSEYKYKKNISNKFSNEIRTQFKVFMESLDD